MNSESSLPRSVLDGTILLLLCMAPIAGVILFGGVRPWSVLPLLSLSLLGSALCFLTRPTSCRTKFDMADSRLPTADAPASVSFSENQKSKIENRKSEVRLPPGWLLWMAFMAYVFCTVPWAAVPYEAWLEALKYSGLLFAYWAWTEMAGHGGRWKTLLALLLLLAAADSIYALYQYAHGCQWVLNWPQTDYEMRASGTHYCPKCQH